MSFCEDRPVQVGTVLSSLSDEFGLMSSSPWRDDTADQFLWGTSKSNSSSEWVGQQQTKFGEGTRYSLPEYLSSPLLRLKLKMANESESWFATSKYCPELSN